MSARIVCIAGLPGFLTLCGCLVASNKPAASEEERKAEAAAAAKAVYKEESPIRLTGAQAIRHLTAIAVDADDRLLACDAQRTRVHVIRDGQAETTWELDFRPEAIAVGPAGAVYVAGERTLARLARDGKVDRGTELQGKGVAALAASDKDVFVVLRGDTGFTIVRYTVELADPQIIVKGVRGCCGTLDIAAHGDKLLVAENTRHRVGLYDRDGKLVGKFGSEGTKDVAAFGGCCNPMNVCVGPNGDVFTAESGPDRVKRYKPDGEYVELVGWFRGGKTCQCVDIATARDARTVYVADTSNQSIRVLKRSEPPTSAPAKEPPVARGAQP